MTGGYARILTVTPNPALDLSTEAGVVRPEHKIRCAAPRVDPGGGGVNVSRAIRQLGGASLAVVMTGGATGVQLLDLLAREGVDCRAVDVGAETRRSLAVRDLAGDTQYRFLLPGPPWPAAASEAALTAAAAIAGPGDLAVLSGSLPDGAPPNFFARLAARFAASGAAVALDTSGDPLEAAAQGGGARLAALRMDDVEAEALVKHPLPDVAATAAFAAALVAHGAAAMVAVARGAEGTVIADATGRWLCAPPAVPVVSKVGAGDSFVAAFAMALAAGADAPSACARGVAAAAAAVMTPDTRLCEAATVAQLTPQVVTTALP